MEKYRRTLILRCIGSITIAAVVAVLGFYFQANPIKLSFDGYGAVSNGLVIAFVVYYALVYCLKTGAVLYNDKRKRQSLKEYYEEEHEERKVLIDQKTASYSVYLLLFLIVIAQIVVGSQNSSVRVTLNAVLAAYVVVSLGMLLYFRHKY